MKRLSLILVVIALITGCSKKSATENINNNPSTPLRPDTIPANWVKMNVASSNATDVFFTDNANGWATGADGIYRSINGGVAWNRINTTGGAVNIGA